MPCNTTYRTLPSLIIPLSLPLIPLKGFDESATDLNRNLREPSTRMLIFKISATDVERARQAESPSSA
ncbi:hypothetical protein SNOG_15520 [Parastagonospora nodorum SN15]|uniref:Uncharacterized protein n=1 Tax=Phaeosphaeria nodorum (strain SN15 / ATCC MYA-4574 / FGSC 10173) TaxID=321614 RepID=Q0TYI3_PHANO|nr:hypothetical protein SNOG_15520 [Parastagonospora nodorum SN15]EAT77185.1 hypothetical protein SNOG_15520 [Parastagonospora nodorum SN15]